MLSFIGLIHAPEVGWAANPEVALGYAFFGLVCLAYSFLPWAKDPVVVEQRDHELPRRRGVPRQRSTAARCLLDGDMLRRHGRRDEVVVASGLHGETSDLYVRGLVLGRPEPDAADRESLLGRGADLCSPP